MPTLTVVGHFSTALIVAWIVPRRVLMLAKATLFDNPIGGALLSWLGVLPLRRASDESGRAGEPEVAAFPGELGEHDECERE